MSWTKEEKSILWITSANHFLVHIIEMGFPALVIPLSQYFGLSLGASIALCQGLYLAYGFGALPAGIISDKWNIRYMLGIGALGSAAACFAASAAPNAATLVIALTFLGLFASIYHPTGISLITHSVSQRGKALGLNGVCGNIGFAVAPLIAGFSNYFWGWRSCFIVIGLIALVVGLSAFLMNAIPPKPQERHAPGTAEEKQLAAYFVMVCVIILVAGLLYRAVTVSIPAYMENFGPSVAAGITQAVKDPIRNLTANMFVFVIYSGGILGQFLGGMLADRYDLRKAYLLYYIGIIPMALMMAVARNYSLVAAAAGLIFFTLGMQPIENSLIARLTPVRWRSTAFGFKFILGLGVGSLAVSLVGYTQGRFGFPSVFIMSSCISAVVAALIMVLWFISRKMQIKNIHKPLHSADLVIEQD